MPVSVTNLDEQTRHWHVCKWENKYTIVSLSVYSKLVLTEEPMRIRISLNCEGGLAVGEGNLMNVILDPDTAHPERLDITEDHKSIKGVRPVKPIYPAANWKSFEYNRYVLGCQWFSTGRHFWEVIVGDTAGWRVGVAKKPLNVKNVDLQTRHWHIELWGGKYRIFSPSVCTELVLTEKPTRIHISLNCEGGQVSFFDARTAALLHTFSDASLAGETLLPCFFLRDGACITLP
ncbi:butyrophilin subfamily 1 member A1-like [Vipera latastei]